MRRKAALAGGALLAAIAVLFFAAQPDTALAHANLEIADPAPDSELETSPDRVVIQFTEPLEERFSEIRVLDLNGTRVDNGDTLLDTTDPTVLAVTLPELPNGTYTVSWTNVSTVDGHRVNGAYVFAVGEPISGGLTVDDEPVLQSQSEPYFRWIVLLGGLAAFGGIFFQAFVVQPPLTQIGKNLAVGHARDAMLRRGEVGIWVAVGVFAVGSLLHLVRQTATTFGSSFWGAIGGDVGTIISDTAWGQDWVVRAVLIGVAGALLIAAQFVPSPERVVLGGVTRKQVFTYSALTPLGAALFMLSRISHGAGTAGITGTALVIDYAHLLAAAVWVGGLVQLLIGLPVLVRASREGVLRRIVERIVPRFSAVALVSAGILLVTGVFSAWAQMSTWEAFGTAYGYALIAKLLVLVPLVGAAAFNLLWIRPRLHEATGRLAGLLRRTVALEVASVALVLLAVGYLTALEPGRQVASREAAAVGPSLVETNEGATIETQLTHARVGANGAVITLTDQRGNRIENASNVEMVITGISPVLPAELVRATDNGNGEWLIEDLRLSVAGVWQVETVVRRPDSFDARTAFRFDIGGTSGGSSLFSPNPNTAAILFGGVIAVAGMMILFSSIPLGAFYTRGGLAVASPGLAVAIVGVVVLGNGVLSSGSDVGSLSNPYAPTAASVELGQDAYGRTCAACHGTEGLGDGPSAATLSSPPADLTIHVPLHSDADLFTFMRDGITGTPMESLSNVLTEDEMWHVVNYVRVLVEDGR